METLTPEKTSLFGLIRNVADETKTFVRQEAQLLKAELSEKFSRMAKNSVTVAIGGAVAYAGLIVFFIGVGWLLAWAFEKAGLAPLFAGFLGLAVMGLLVTVIGGVMVLGAVKSISQQSLAPERTIRTLQELQGKPPVPVVHPEAETKVEPRSSAELQSRVEATEKRLTGTLDELGRRVTPRHLRQQAVQSIKDRPYYSSLGAMIAGFFSAFFITRRVQR